MRGPARTFTCPYHHWVYGLDGRLLGAPAMERTHDFDKKDWGLPNLAVEEWQGFVFVNFDRDAAPLAPDARPLRAVPRALRPRPTAVCPGTFTLTDLPWNWKVMFENFNDGYHANRLHQVIQDFCPSELAAFPVPWDDASNVIFRTNGYTHIDGGFNATTKALLPIFPELTEEERWRSTFALVPPTLCLGTAPDQAFFFIVTPEDGRAPSTSRSATCSTRAPLEHPMFDAPLRHVATPACRCSSGRTRTPPPRSSAACAAASPRAVATRGRRRATSQFNRWLVQRYREHYPIHHTTTAPSNGGGDT